MLALWRAGTDRDVHGGGAGAAQADDQRAARAAAVSVSGVPSLIRHSGASRSDELWCAIAHLRISLHNLEIPGSRFARPGMTVLTPANAASSPAAPPAPRPVSRRSWRSAPAQT